MVCSIYSPLLSTSCSAIDAAATLGACIWPTTLVMNLNHFFIYLSRASSDKWLCILTSLVNSTSRYVMKCIHAILLMATPVSPVADLACFRNFSAVQIQVSPMVYFWMCRWSHKSLSWSWGTNTMMVFTSIHVASSGSCIWSKALDSSFSMLRKLVHLVDLTGIMCLCHWLKCFQVFWKIVSYCKSRNLRVVSCMSQLLWHLVYP